MKKMQRLQAYYDCQICGEKHKLRAKWKFQTQGFSVKYINANFEQTVRDTIVEIAKEMLRKLHPLMIFEWDRLHCE